MAKRDKFLKKKKKHQVNAHGIDNDANSHNPKRKPFILHALSNVCGIFQCFVCLDDFASACIYNRNTKSAMRSPRTKCYLTFQSLFAEFTVDINSYWWYWYWEEMILEDSPTKSQTNVRFLCFISIAIWCHAIWSNASCDNWRSDLNLKWARWFQSLFEDMCVLLAFTEKKEESSAMLIGGTIIVTVWLMYGSPLPLSKRYLTFQSISTEWNIDINPYW